MVIAFHYQEEKYNVYIDNVLMHEGHTEETYANIYDIQEVYERAVEAAHNGENVLIYHIVRDLE